MSNLSVENGSIRVARSAEELVPHTEGGIFHNAPKEKYGPQACAVCGTYFSEDPSRWAIDRQRSLDAIARLATDPIVEEAKRGLAMGDDQRLCNTCHLYVVHGYGAAHAVCDLLDDRYGPEPELSPLKILRGLLDYAVDQRKFARNDEEDPRMRRGSMARRVQIVIDRLSDLEAVLEENAQAREVLHRLERERQLTTVVDALFVAKPALGVIYNRQCASVADAVIRNEEEGSAPEEMRSVHYLLYRLHAFEKWMSVTKEPKGENQ